MPYSYLKGKPCTYQGCDNPQIARGFCPKHYARLRLHGNPSIKLLTGARRDRKNDSYIKDGVGYIDLGKGRYALVDEKNFDSVNRFRWSSIQGRYTYYASGVLSAVRGGNGKHSTMHRLILGRAPDGMEIDHRNGLGYDNRESNLRFVTIGQNMQNQRRNASGKSSRFKGVSLERSTGKWLAKIRNRNLGRYSCEEDAAIAYNVAAQIFFGEHACLNPV